MGQFDSFFKKLQNQFKHIDLSDREDAKYVEFDDIGVPIGLKDTKSLIMQLKHHPLAIDQIGNEIHIKSLVDPTIQGYIKYANDHDSNLAFTALSDEDTIMSYIRNHGTTDDTAYKLTQILADEKAALNKEKRSGAAAKVNDSKSSDAFNDDDDIDNTPEPEPDAEPPADDADTQP